MQWIFVIMGITVESSLSEILLLKTINCFFMQKPVLSLLAAIVCSLSAMADINTVVVTSEGKSTNIAFDEKPVVTVTDDALIVTTDSGLELTYSTDKVVDFTLADSSGIRDLLIADYTTPTFYMEGNVMKIYNLEPNSAVALYGLDGIVYLRGCADADGYLEIIGVR